jgi:hypothetical protein
MVDEAPKDQEPSGGRPPAGTSPAEEPKLNKALSLGWRVLSEEEIASPAGRVLLITELNRLQTENVELTGYRDRYYDVHEKCAVLEEKEKGREKGRLASDIVFTASISLGIGLLGALPGLWPLIGEKSPGYLWLMLTVGVLLVGTGVSAKWIRQR